MKAPLLFILVFGFYFFAYTQSPPCDCTLTQGDFSSPLPFMSTNSTAVNFYAYGNPIGASANTGLELGETLLVMLHEDTNTGNTSLIVILDIGNDATGGDVDMTVNCLPDSAAVALQDDGGELFGSPPTITGDYFWSPCCTDGGVISGVGCGNTITINPTINSGINFFSLVYGTPGNPTYINMPDIQCPITINCGGVSCCDDAFDFSAVTQDPNCENSNDGSIDLETDCATTPTFQWSNNATTEDVSGLGPGTYSVTITDVNNCSQTSSYTLTAGSSPQPVISGPTEFCEGEEIVLSVIGAYPGYLWTGGSTGPTLTVDDPGDYSVIVTDGSGCTGTDFYTVTENPVPIVDDYGEYCEGAAYFYPGNAQTYTQGDYTITYSNGSSLGCDSIVMLHVIEHPTEVVDIIRTICEGEEVIINFVPYTQTGFYTIDLQTTFGCDSTIFLDLTVLNPEAIIEPPDTWGCNVTQVLIDGSMSMGGSFDWSTDVGFICSGNGTPVIIACLPGNYCLTVTSYGLDQGQLIECTDEMCVEVVEDNNTPVLFISNVEDETCTDANDGSATVEVSSGGVPPFITTWNSSPIQLGETVTDLPCGQVCATVTGANGCSETICVMINCPESIVLSTTGDDVLCNGEDSGSATAIADGGAGGFSFAWDTNPIETTATINGLSAGTYTVTVTDANECTEESSVVITEPAAFDVNLSTNDALCNGGSSGSATISVSGGAGLLTYLWSPGGQDTDTAVNLTAGDYTVLVTDENGCTVEETVTITEPPAITLQTSNTETSCNNTPDGSATVMPSGGTGGYTYLWTPGNQETPTADNLTSGDYTVVVTDDNDCTATAIVTVSSPNGMTVNPSFTNASCNGGADGSATVTTSGGTPDYQYTWDTSPVQTTETATGLSAGTYNVTIEDMNGCEEYETFVITEPTAVTLSSTTTDALCNEDANGSATVTPSGGTGDYDYEWDTTPEQITATATGLGAGSYTVLVTDDNGCTATETVMISEPAVLSLTTNQTDALCNQSADGTATVVPSGGTGPYSYAWTGGQVDATAIDLLAGNYTVIVEDANGCTEEASVIIEEPEALALSLTGVDPDCNQSLNGTATVAPSGGTGAYTYLWDDGQSTSTAIGLDGGLIGVVVTDANGCSETESINLIAPPALSLMTSQENILCFGEETGTATVTPNGGTGPYTYQWDDNASQNTATAINLAAGTYTPTVTDANDCTAEITVDLTEPTAALAATGTSTDALCGQDDGTIDLTVTGGTPPYTYEWSNNDTNQDPQNLGPGTYSVVITDANGCTFTTSVQVSTPSGLEALVSVTDANCNGESNGQVDITVNGGVTPYDYQWSDPTYNGQQDLVDVLAGNYMLTLTDADGCTVTASAIVGQPALLTGTATPSQASCGGSDGSISLVVSGGTTPYGFEWENDVTGETYPNQSPNGLPQGNYTGVVTDDNGCSITLTASVTVPDGPVANISAVNLSCFEDNSGSIEVTVVGGEMPYTYEWNDAAYNGQEDLSDIPAGIWEVLITDDNSCSTTVMIEVTQPPPLEATSLGATSVTCNGDNNGSIVISVSGGTLPYVSYQWDNTSQMIPDPDGLSAGSYTLTVTDSQGCTTLSETIIITEPEALVLTTTTVAAACNGSSDGSIELTVMGGTTPYSYSWNNGAYTDEDLLNIPAGQYSIVVTDAEGCTQTTAATVDQPQALEIVIDNVSNYGGYNVTCWNATDGTAEAIASGGTEPFSYAWSNGMNAGPIEGLTPGVYTVTVTDTEGCTNTSQVNLTAPQPIEAMVEALAADCYGESDGQVIVTSVSGGAAPFMYSIGGSLSPMNQFLNLPEGEYEVTVEDVNGCQWTTMVEVTEPEEFVVDLGADIEILLGDSTQLQPLLYPGGSVVDTFVWKEREVIEFEPWVIPTETQSYTIVVTNQGGCKAEDMILVRVKKERLVYIPNTFTPNNDGFNDIFWIQTGRGVASINNFRIFSRWGELVYENLSPQLGITYADPENGWDGKLNGEPMNPGVFVYVVEVTFIDGRVEIYKGDVTLKK